MDWSDLTRLAADPNVTIGCATVNFSALSNLEGPGGAARDDDGPRRRADRAAPRVRHFAYPFGDRDSFRRAHVVMAAEAGFVSAVSTIPGIVEPAGRTNLRALPRIAWDGRRQSLRIMRVPALGRCLRAGEADPERAQL